MAGHLGKSKETYREVSQLSSENRKKVLAEDRAGRPPAKGTKRNLAGSPPENPFIPEDCDISPHFLDRIPVGLAKINLAGDILAANTLAAGLLGTVAGALAGGNIKSKLLPGSSGAVDDFLSKLAVAFEPVRCSVMAGEPARHLEICAVRTRGANSFYAEIRDISELVRSRAEREFLNSISQARLHLALFGNTHSLEEVLVETLDILENLTGSLIGFYHFLLEDQKTLSLQAWSTRTCRTYCTASGKGSHYSVDNAGVWVDCIRSRKTVIHNDYQTMPDKKGLPPGHASLVRELVVPVIRGDKIVAVLGVGNKEDDYSEDDAKLVEKFADLAWDIAERKIMFQKLKASEANFRAIAEYTYDWELWVGTDGSLCWTNPAAKAITGYTADEIAAMEGFPEKVVLPGDREYFMKHYNEAIEGKSGENVEFRIKKKDGSSKWCSLAYQSIFDDKGSRLGFRASIRDITALKRTYEELDRMNEKLITMITSRRK